MQKLKDFIGSKGFKSLTKDSSWVIFSQIFIVLVNLGTVYILANFLSQENYGQFKLITTWLGIALGVGYTGYTYTLPQRIAANGTYDLTKIFRETFIKSLPTFIGMFALSLYYFFNSNINLGSGFFFASFLAPVLCTAAIVNLYYLGKKNFKLFALTQNAVDLIQLTTIALVAYYSENFALIISVYFVATIFANIFIILKTIRDDKKFKSDNPNRIGSITNNVPGETINIKKIQSKLNLSAIVLGFTNQLDKLLIFHFIGAAPLAIYSIVTAISDQARTPAKAIGSALFPRMTHEKFTKKKLYIAFVLLTLMCLVIFISLVLLYPFIFSILFPKYSEYIYLANIASVSIIFAPYQLLYLYAQSKNDLGTINNFANLNTGLQVILFICATILQSLPFFLLTKTFIMFISTIFILYKINSYKENFNHS